MKGKQEHSTSPRRQKKWIGDDDGCASLSPPNHNDDNQQKHESILPELIPERRPQRKPQANRGDASDSSFSECSHLPPTIDHNSAMKGKQKHSTSPRRQKKWSCDDDGCASLSPPNHNDDFNEQKHESFLPELTPERANRGDARASSSSECSHSQPTIPISSPGVQNKNRHSIPLVQHIEGPHIPQIDYVLDEDNEEEEMIEYGRRNQVENAVIQQQEAVPNAVMPIAAEVVPPSELEIEVREHQLCMLELERRAREQQLIMREREIEARERDLEAPTADAAIHVEEEEPKLSVEKKGRCRRLVFVVAAGLFLITGLVVAAVVIALDDGDGDDETPSPTTDSPTTAKTLEPTTVNPTTFEPTMTFAPTTIKPTTSEPTDCSCDSFDWRVAGLSFSLNDCTLDDPSWGLTECVDKSGIECNYHKLAKYERFYDENHTCTNEFAITPPAKETDADHLIFKTLKLDSETCKGTFDWDFFGTQDDSSGNYTNGKLLCNDNYIFAVVGMLPNNHYYLDFFWDNNDEFYGFGNTNANALHSSFGYKWTPYCTGISYLMHMLLTDLNTSALDDIACEGEEYFCEDDEDWFALNYTTADCRLFSIGQTDDGNTYCDAFGDSPNDLTQKTANEACCACGGGTRTTK